MVIALLVAAAVMVWPTAVPAVRGSTGRPRGWFFDRRGLGRPLTARSAAGVVVLSVAVVLLVRWGAAVAVSGAVLGTTVWGLSRRLRAGRDRRVALEQIVAALRMLARELHAGADPAPAARDTAAAATGDGAVVVSELVHAIGIADRTSAGAQPVSNRLPAGWVPPGSVSGSRLRSASGERGRLGPQRSVLQPRMVAVARLRTGWTLTRRHGIAFTPMIDALAAELAEQLVADSRRAGEVAGPRMSGYVMAVLPLLGLLLGAGMGADPVEVLFGTHLGNVLLVVGTALTCAGLSWSARIVDR